MRISGGTVPHGIENRGLAFEAVRCTLTNLLEKLVEGRAEDENLENLEN